MAQKVCVSKYRVDEHTDAIMGEKGVREETEMRSPAGGVWEEKQGGLEL